MVANLIMDLGTFYLYKKSEYFEYFFNLFVLVLFLNKDFNFSHPFVFKWSLRPCLKKNRKVVFIHNFTNSISFVIEIISTKIYFNTFSIEKVVQVNSSVSQITLFNFLKLLAHMLLTRAFLFW